MRAPGARALSVRTRPVPRARVARPQLDQCRRVRKEISSNKRHARDAPRAPGITKRAARHIFEIADALAARLKPGEALSVGAYALELYNEDLRDLSVRVRAEYGGLVKLA